MKLTVTGSLTWTDVPSVREPLDRVRLRCARPGSPLVVVNGVADEGLDHLVDAWSREHPEDVLQISCPADWGGPCGASCPPGHRRRNRRGVMYCPTAGHRRNQDMIDKRPDRLLAWAKPCRRRKPWCPTGLHPSHGTADCVRRARAAHIPVSFSPAGLSW